MCLHVELNCLHPSSPYLTVNSGVADEIGCSVQEVEGLVGWLVWAFKKNALYVQPCTQIQPLSLWGPKQKLFHCNHESRQAWGLLISSGVWDADRCHVSYLFKDTFGNINGNLVWTDTFLSSGILISQAEVDYPVGTCLGAFPPKWNGRRVVGMRENCSSP